MSTNNQCEKMENLKIKLKPSDSQEAQLLFFSLGYAFDCGVSREVQDLEYVGVFYMFAYKDDLDLTHSCDFGIFASKPHKEITLPELLQLAGRESLNDQYAEIEKVRHSHYFKDVSDIDEIDVYEVLHRFGVTDPCLQHIVKKALCAGERGHKDFHTDLKNIADTAQRMLQIHGL